MKFDGKNGEVSNDNACVNVNMIIGECYEDKNEYENLTILPRGIDKSYCPEYLFNTSCECWDKALELGEKYGYRNAQVSVLAPTGTIGLLMDCDTTGIEPDFAIVKYKKLAGGGYFKIVNQSVKLALKKLGYTPEQIKDIEAYTTGALTLKNCPYINEESLKERGFTDEKIQLIEQQLPTVFNIRFAFNKYILGEDFLVSLGIDQAELNLPQFDLLSTLGYNEDEIEIANSYVTGTMTIEGAPHLSEEDLPIFDCANKCGKLGKRFISYMAHLRAMSAAQPFISGAISKTVNMPADATVQDIGDVYTNAYNMMIKAVALYRDNSKLSQPLNTTLNDFDEVVSLGDENTLDETKGPAEVYKIQKSKLERKRLPLRRSGITREVTIQNQKVYLRTGEYEDGSLGEIFIDMYKEGAAFRGLINSFAILTSKALQYGIPLHDLVNTFKFTRFEPAGIVQGHEEIRFTTSVLDYIFQSLEYDYITNKREVVKTEEVHHHHIETKQANTTSNDKNSKLANAKSLGYTGEQCPTCGSIRLKRNGSCMICEECGSTTGCS